MTDWLPVVGVGLAGTFATLYLILAALRKEEATARARTLTGASRMWWGTVVVTAAVYALYLAFDENWLWY